MDAVQLVDVTYKAPQQLNDVRVLLVGFLEKLKAKEPVTQIIFEELENLQKAVQGIGDLPEEFKEQLRASLECTGHMGGAITGVLLA